MTAPPLPSTAPIRLVPGPDRPAPDVTATLTAVGALADGYVEGRHEGPGAMVSPAVWQGAVRRLADDLLRPAADADGAVPVGRLDESTAAVAERLYGPDAPAPAADRAPWQGRVLFVLGCGRSGTTWLERMLMASPDAGGVDGAESFLFTLAHPLWEALRQSCPTYDRDLLVPALRTFCDTVLEETLAAHAPGARVFVEKTPMHSLIIPELAAVYPDAHYLHLVRDGRDVARSISKVPFFNLPDPADAAAGWRRVLHRVRHDAPLLARFREVRYEDLLHDPMGGVGALLRWAELDDGPAAHEALRERVGTRVSTHAGTDQPPGTGTWRSLSRPDLARVLGECGGQLVAEGYLSRRGLLRAQVHPAYWSRRVPRLRARVARAARLR